jgi:hypothetical protein
VPDLLTLANSSLDAMLDAIEAECEQQGENPEAEAQGKRPVPDRIPQIAELILSEAVRLIRLGSRRELSEGAVSLARARLTPALRRLGREDPESHQLITAAALASGAASSPSARGSELTVLQSWNGRALEVVRLLSEAPGEVMARKRLRERLGNPSDSYLSHLLSDLEAAGLIVRVRDSRSVTVHLGPVAREPHVRDRLPRRDLVRFWSAPVEMETVKHVYSWSHEFHAPAQFHRVFNFTDTEPGLGAEEVVSSDPWVGPKELLQLAAKPETRDLGPADPWFAGAK